MQGSLHVLFFSTMFLQWDGLLVCFHLGLVSVLFYMFIPTSKDLLQKIFPLVSVVYLVGLFC